MSWADDYKHEDSAGGLNGMARCIISDVQEKRSSKGNPMIVVTLRASGVSFDINHYIVKNEYFNRNMSRFFDAFPEIEDGDFDFIRWIGCEGGAVFGPDDMGYTKLKRFLTPEQTATLPEFKGERPVKHTVTSVAEFSDISPDDIPFL